VILVRSAEGLPACPDRLLGPGQRDHQDEGDQPRPAQVGEGAWGPALGDHQELFGHRGGRNSRRCEPPAGQRDSPNFGPEGIGCGQDNVDIDCWTDRRAGPGYGSCAPAD